MLVAQLGARRHYAVPLAFQEHGLLERFCTDLLIKSNRMRGLVRSAGSTFGNGGLRRLADRQFAQSPSAELTRTFPLFGMRYKWRGQRAASAQARTANWMWGGRRFAQLCAEQLSAQTTGVYAFTSAARELFSVAKARGIPCWLDHATAPRAFEVGLIQEEAERFPGWSVRPVEDTLTDAYLARQREELQLSDKVICGCSFAKRAIQAEGVSDDKIAVVPLGIADHLYTERSAEAASKHSELRVLYVGGDGLRKGIGYLAQAVEMLGSSKVEVKAAGELELSEHACAELSRSMQLLGTVPRSQMAALFDWADVLVLPSVCDTFGFVLLEAMAAGLPVIASENCAGPDLVREGRDGFVVPIRNPQIIADRLEQLATDRSYLRFMSEQARDRAKEFCVSRYGDRLMQALGLNVIHRGKESGV